MSKASLIAPIAMIIMLSGCEKASPTQNLNAAAGICDVQGVKDALAEKADVNSPPSESDGGETTLMTASYNGCADVARELLAAGANVNAKIATGPLSGETALTLGTNTRGNADTIKALIAGGADVNAKAEGGETALGIAARYGKLEIVEALVAAGADVNAVGALSETPLAEARSAASSPSLSSNSNFGTPQGHIAIVNFLSAHGGQ